VQAMLSWILTTAIFATGIGYTIEAHAGPSAQFEERVFSKLDANSDKKLTESEFVGEKAGKAATKAKKQFQVRDKNGDKSLTLKEYSKRT
jgi:hypothetical protein